MTATLHLIVSEDDLAAGAFARAAEILRNGGLVAFPTETVYGLGADAQNPEAVRRIFVAKQRPLSDPLIVHVSDTWQVYDVASSVPEVASRLIETFWPGPLTLVLPRRESVPDIVSAGGPTVGVRMPNHPIALALLRRAGVPVAAPSANRFMHTSPTTAQHVLADLAGRIDCVLDAGPSLVGIESTVVDVTATPPRLLRPGAVTMEALQPFVPQLQEPGFDDTRSLQPSGGSLAAPGQLERHYAPRTRLLVFDTWGTNAIPVVHAEVERLLSAGVRVGVLLPRGEEEAIRGLDVPVAWLGRADRLDIIAQELYARLRDMDAQGLDVLITHTFGRSGLGLALWDRLRRAAGGRFQAPQHDSHE